MTNKIYQDLVVNGTIDITGGGQLGSGLKELIKEYIDSIRYDANGDCYYFSDDPTSPAIRYGGTWERINDKFILAAGDTYAAGTTGGSADAVVIQHRHNVHIYSGVGGISWDGYSLQRGYLGNNENNSEYNVDHGENVNGPNAYFIEMVGESGASKNMPPYFVVYVWHKISN